MRNLSWSCMEHSHLAGQDKGSEREGGPQLQQREQVLARVLALAPVAAHEGARAAQRGQRPHVARLNSQPKTNPKLTQE